MNYSSVLPICIGAPLGALLRFGLGLCLNPIFPTVPLGTLAANILGGFFIGIIMALLELYPAIPSSVRFGVITGFLGSLTTFSTFSAETVTLLSHQQYLWSCFLVVSHVIGSLIATFAGIQVVKTFVC